MEQQTPAQPPEYDPPAVEDMPTDGPSSVCAMVSISPNA
jgi:hypothetical protein